MILVMQEYPATTGALSGCTSKNKAPDGRTGSSFLRRRFTIVNVLNAAECPNLLCVTSAFLRVSAVDLVQDKLTAETRRNAEVTQRRLV